MWNEWSGLVVTLKCIVIHDNSMANNAGVTILHLSYVLCKRLLPADLMVDSLIRAITSHPAVKHNRSSSLHQNCAAPINFVSSLNKIRVMISRVFFYISLSDEL